MWGADVRLRDKMYAKHGVQYNTTIIIPAAAAVIVATMQVIIRSLQQANAQDCTACLNILATSIYCLFL